MKQAFPLSLEKSFTCGLCSSAYVSEDISLIDEQEEKNVYYAKCPTCDTSVIITVNVQGQGIIGTGIITDLSLSEVSEKFLQTPKISEDQIITVYKKLFPEKRKVANISKK